MKFRKSAHAIYKTEYHLVWIPRYRRKIFVKGVKEYAEKLFSHLPELDPDIEVIKLNVPILQRSYMTREGIWSRGYCVSCIGLDEKEILAYVEHQEKDDKGQLQLMF